MAFTYLKRSPQQCRGLILLHRVTLLRCFPQGRARQRMVERRHPTMIEIAFHYLINSGVMTLDLLSPEPPRHTIA
jgi:hypothetical protein